MSRTFREDPRIRRTRQLIVQAFQELLGEQDFESLTIQEIADRATVNRVTVYAHFADKYALLDFAFTESFTAASYAHCAPSGGAHVEAGIGQQLQRQLYTFLLTWLNKTEADQSMTELRATIASWAIYGVSKRWSEGQHNESVQDFARQALPMIAASFNVHVDSTPRHNLVAQRQSR